MAVTVTVYVSFVSLSSGTSRLGAYLSGSPVDGERVHIRPAQRVRQCLIFCRSIVFRDGVGSSYGHADVSDRLRCRDVFTDHPLLVRLVPIHLIVLVREHRLLVARVRQNLVRCYHHGKVLGGISFVRTPVSIQRYGNQDIAYVSNNGCVGVRCLTFDEAVVGISVDTFIVIQSVQALLRHTTLVPLPRDAAPRLCCPRQPGWPSLGNQPAAAGLRG